MSTSSPDDARSSSSLKVSSNTSPPAYSETDPASVYPLPSPLLRFPTPTPHTPPFAGPSSAHAPNHQLFGPTPITTQPLVPYAYYDAHSPHSIAQADARARRRFLGGFLWALMAWIVLGVLVGALEMVDDEGIFVRTWTQMSQLNPWGRKEEGI